MDERLLLKEKTLHGSKNFPVCIYRNCADEGYILNTHWHDEAEFIYLATGDMVFYIDTVPVEVQAGEILFVNRGRLHGGKAKSPQKSTFYSIVFNLNIFHNELMGTSYDSYILPLIENKIGFPQKITNDNYGRNIQNCLLRIIENYYTRSPGFEITVIAEFYNILSSTIACGKMALKKSSISTSEKLRAERFREAINYIHNNYAKRISINDMAKAVNMSPNYFCHCFRSFSNRTPIEYLNAYRINRAAYLLRQTDENITSISLDTGFYNISYFNKLFKQIKGCTPAVFRRQNSAAGTAQDYQIETTRESI